MSYQQLRMSTETEYYRMSPTATEERSIDNHGYVTTHRTGDTVLDAFMEDLFKKLVWYKGKFNTFGLASPMTKYLKSLNAQQWEALSNYVTVSSYTNFVDKLKRKYKH